MDACLWNKGIAAFGDKESGRLQELRIDFLQFAKMIVGVAMFATLLRIGALAATITSR